MSASSRILSEVGPLDWRPVYRVIEESWLANYRQFMPLRAILPHAGRRLERYIRRLLLAPGSRAFLVRNVGAPVAAMTIKRFVEAVEVDDLFVLPGWTSRGIGRELLDTAKSIARDRGVPLRLEAMRDNRGARRFYEREGGRLLRLAKYGWGRGDYPSVFYRWIKP